MITRNNTARCSHLARFSEGRRRGEMCRFRTSTLSSMGNREGGRGVCTVGLITRHPNALIRRPRAIGSERSDAPAFVCIVVALPQMDTTKLQIWGHVRVAEEGNVRPSSRDEPGGKHGDMQTGQRDLRATSASSARTPPSVAVQPIAAARGRQAAVPRDLAALLARKVGRRTGAGRHMSGGEEGRVTASPPRRPARKRRYA